MPEIRVTAQQKKAVAERAGGCCEYCRSQARFAMQSFSIEHIVPRSLGGKTTLDNMALSCQGCNNYKYNKVEAEDPISGEIVKLYHPRRQEWNEHFVWRDDYSSIIGVTPIGRATVAALKLNRECLVNLRKMLYKYGEHPPLIAGEQI